MRSKINKDSYFWNTFDVRTYIDTDCLDIADQEICIYSVPKNENEIERKFKYHTVQGDPNKITTSN